MLCNSYFYSIWVLQDREFRLPTKNFLLSALFTIEKPRCCRLISVLEGVCFSEVAWVKFKIAEKLWKWQWTRTPDIKSGAEMAFPNVHNGEIDVQILNFGWRRTEKKKVSHRWNFLSQLQRRWVLKKRKKFRKRETDVRISEKGKSRTVHIHCKIKICVAVIAANFRKATTMDFFVYFRWMESKRDGSKQQFRRWGNAVDGFWDGKYFKGRKIFQGKISYKIEIHTARTNTSKWATFFPLWLY